ncbi:MAG: hypothetical protein K0T99_02030 [Alphaproteobacteria bacterium]|nr:hypothetical protein [Alphaproteobacteria bacterium]
MGYKYPYKRRPRRNIITKELREKHKLGLTLSPIDLCLRKDLITKDMHRAANHFIFLHNARFSTAKLKCQISKCYHGIFEETLFEKPTEELLEEVRKEYIAVVELLKSVKSYEVMMDICVYNIYPCFLKKIGSLDESIYYEFMKFKRALEDMNRFMIKNISIK